MKPRVRPRIISPFIKGDKGKCVECGVVFPLDEMCLLARTWFDRNIVPMHHYVVSFDLYCKECFDLISEGDDKAWREAL